VTVPFTYALQEASAAPPTPKQVQRYSDPDALRVTALAAPWAQRFVAGIAVTMLLSAEPQRPGSGAGVTVTVVLQEEGESVLLSSWVQDFTVYVPAVAQEWVTLCEVPLGTYPAAGTHSAGAAPPSQCTPYRTGSPSGSVPERVRVTGAPATAERVAGQVGAEGELFVATAERLKVMV
jgi:hypothetical protein